MIPKKYTYDDVLLVPQFSALESRLDVDLRQNLFEGIPPRLPFLSANMDSVTEVDMAEAMYAAGGMGVLHRYVPKATIIEWLAHMSSIGARTIPSVGLRGDPVGDALAYTKSPATCAICVDVAHAHTPAIGELVTTLVGKGVTVMAGNVATPGAALFLAKAGASYIKVGVGPGAVCTTRTVTGHGYPQLSAVLECAKAIKDSQLPALIIADGGLRSTGDIVKALAAGASAVMLGYLLAGCDETPKGTEYRGMASTAARYDASKSVEVKYAPEGVVRNVLPKGPTHEVVTNLCAGVRSGLSYSGANSVQSLQHFAEFINVSGPGLKETYTISDGDS